MMSLQQLTFSLRTYKGHVTRSINNCNAIVTTPVINKDQLDLKIKFLETKWPTFDNAYNLYEAKLLSEEGIKAEEVERVQEEYYEFCDHYQTKLLEFKSYMKDTVTSTGNNTSLHSNVVSSKPKLPIIKLATFKGDYTDYESFIDQFSSQVGSRDDLDAVTKLQYLKSQLDGYPFELVKGFSSISENYQHALDILKETYGDTERIKRAILFNIIDLESPRANKGELEKFRIALLNLTKSLENKHQYSCCEWIVASIFQRKLPNLIIRQLYLKYNTNYFTIKQLNDGIRDCIAHMEVENINKESKRIKTESVSVPSSEEISPKNIGSYYTKEAKKGTNSTGNQLRKCIYCGKEHSTSKCEGYETLGKRRARLVALGRCSRCLSLKHSQQECTTELHMCTKCKRGRHHTALCIAKPKSEVDEHTKREVTAQQSILSVKGQNQQRSSALPTATVFITDPGYNNHRATSTRAFFDQGSQCTFIKESLVKKLRLQVTGKTRLAVSGFLQTKETEEYDIVRPVVRLGNRRKRISAVVMKSLPDKINIPGLMYAVNRLKSAGVKLADKYLNDDRIEGIDLVVGSDYYGDFIVGLTTKEELKLCQSSGGHLLYGQIGNTHSPTHTQNAVVARICAETVPTDLRDLVEEEVPVHKLWDLDTIGIDSSKPTPEDCLAYENYLETVEYEDNQYWVRLPWKINCPSLPNNYAMAIGQLKNLTKRLKDTKDLDNYDQLLKTQLENGFIEQVPHAKPSESSHYLPHHAVKKDSETTPLRIVFNCSAKRKGFNSLNDCLMTGPSLTNKLGNTLLHFRENKHAYTADISKAFLRVGLQSIDRDYTRFLWFKNPYSEEPEVITYRFKSVLFGATCSPFLLQATLDTHLRNSNNPYKEIISRNFYVDNFQGTTNCKEDLRKIYDNANSELKRANMPLRMWATNESTLKSVIETEFPDSKVPTNTKVLGINWDTESDMISIQCPDVCSVEKSLSKRQLLSLVSSVFDPLGLLSPITIHGKLLIKEAWKLKTSWDEPLPIQFTAKWNILFEEWKHINKYSFPRMIIEQGKVYDMHVFCDASSLAYGAAAYLTTGDESHLVTSKARVVPMKERTLPQLELTAIQIGTHLAHYIQDTMTTASIHNTYIWSDNEAALQWIKNNKSKIPYVRNRVNDIRELASQYRFLHVPTKDNPADYLSRGVSNRVLHKDSFWFKGPQWLCQPNNWPILKEQVISIHATITEADPVEGDRELFKASNYSSMAKVLKVTDKVFKFISILKPSLTLPSSINYWIKMEQRNCYAEEYEYLLQGDDRMKPPDLVKDLGLFINPNTLIIHCRGRLKHSILSEETKYPTLLPRNSWITKLLIDEGHKRVLHGGVADTLADLRQRYWIPKGRQVVKNRISRCIRCKIIEGKPLTRPGPPPLPEERVVHVRPFHTVGIDYTGAITITNTKDKIPKKFYVCLFTCTTSRAVHLELAEDMSAAAFLRLFRRFVARRSCPKKIITDNGSNFKSASTLLKELYNDPCVSEHIHTKAIEWKFITPRAPWMGGFYERMISVLKNCIKKTLFRSKIGEDELRTILTEIEMRVNNRPLTYMEDDINHITPLTPSHLLYGRRLSSLPTEIEYKEDDPDYEGGSDLYESYALLAKTLKHWERVWTNEYLLSLRERFYGANYQNHACKLKVGDVVIVEAEGPRASWPLGLVTRLFPDGEHIVRTVEVLTKGSKYLRTLDKLVPLELHQDQGSRDAVRNDHRRRQPMRHSRQAAEDRTKSLIDAGLV